MAFAPPRPEDEVEMVGHDDVGQDAKGDAGVGFFEGAFEGGVIGFFAEDLGACRGAVHDMIDGVVDK